MKKITKIENTASSKDAIKKKRVAAYCRVSTNSDAQLESLETQKSHYEHYINSRDDWQFAGIYYNAGITGTKKNKRPELLRLIEDCHAGKIDFIITKSISRFSRNTTDCLGLIRELLALHIPIYFEKEKINTGSMTSELFVSVLSSLAESESVSISENNKWSIRRRFETATYKIGYPPYGYEFDGEEMVINPKQAVVVRRIFHAFLSGKGAPAIARELNQEGIPTKRTGHWAPNTIIGMLTNEKYVGDCLYQKTYSDSQFLRHHNHGEMTQYLVQDHHKAIIPRETFEAAQALIQQHGCEKGIAKGAKKYQYRYAFSGKIICGECGDTWRRRIHAYKGNKYIAWCCFTHLQDKTKCHMRYIRDEALKVAFLTMLNKLIFSHRTLLAPYVKALKNAPNNDVLQQIQELKTLLSQNTERSETLTKLMAQGIIDQVIYAQETNILLTQADAYRRQMEALKNTASLSMKHVTEAVNLLHFTEKATLLTQFDDDLFKKFVDRIKIYERNNATFELKCGLHLTERIR